MSGDRGWLALVGDASDRPVAWKGPWTIEKRVGAMPGVAVWTFRHRSDLD
jgi:hypothetical protein